MTDCAFPTAFEMDSLFHMDPLDPPPKLDLEQINHRHIHGIDKFFRMFGGAASQLLSFDDGILELEVRLDNRANRSTPAAMARKLADSWHREPELRSATGFLVHVYKTMRPLGFAIPASGRSKKTLMEDLVRQARKLAKEHPDILLETVRGSF